MTTYPTLFEQFLREECTADARKLIREAAARLDPAGPRLELEFNRFDLVLDFEKRTATIQDVTDTSDKGLMSVAITELLEKIR